MCTGTCTPCHRMLVKIIGQFTNIGSFLLPRGRLNSDHQTCLQVSLPTESAHQPTGVICSTGLRNQLPRSSQNPRGTPVSKPLPFFLLWVTPTGLPKPDIPIHSLSPVLSKPGTAGLQGPAGPASDLPHNDPLPGQRKPLYCLGPLLAPCHRQEGQNYGKAQVAIKGPCRRKGWVQGGRMKGNEEVRGRALALRHLGRRFRRESGLFDS